IVTAISGIERWTVVLSGTAAHAGTTPMDLRRDALAAAAEIILEVEHLARETDRLVGVVGHLEVIPNAVNAVPGEVRLQIEVRSGDDQTRITAGERMADFVARTASRRNLQATAQKTYNQNAVHCDPMLSRALGEAVKPAGCPAAAHLVSGATHDASAMADLTAIAMLFVRCKDGVSHHPDEAVTTEDLECAALVLREFLLRLEVHR
ncbi:MAG: M20/M25/M40 family metallo-hydrolase, partial [Pseudomonadota bacterium]